jgi:hypothetical protein
MDTIQAEKEENERLAVINHVRLVQLVESHRHRPTSPAQVLEDERQVNNWIAWLEAANAILRSAIVP